ncbi:hypothetical protein ACQP00_16270 [Dactylosporangium sp. CS-047395]|uniref:hypothetical protein n=1 Tax=Dactylosporangium sp. CS-047395 TaxID=3239936 RepID=UPI003D9389E5
MTTPLEVRYERLLRLYPAGFRRAHGEDMLTTMLADAGERRRWPRPGDAADIAFHALRLRLFKRPTGGLLGPGWADACALIGPLAAFAILALSATKALRLTMSPGPALLIQIAAWALVTVAAFAGLRRVAGWLGWIAFLTQVVPMVRQFTHDPVPVVYALWWFVAALVAALALSAAGPRGPWEVAGRYRLAVLVGAPLLMGVLAVVSGSGILMRGYDGGSYSAFYLYDLIGPAGGSFALEATGPAVLWLVLAAIAGSAVAFLVALVRLPGPIRRRLLVAAAPVVAMLELVNYGFDGWAVSNLQRGHVIPLVLGQWAALVLLPLLVFLLGVWWVRRRDETSRLAAIGARVERES